MFRGCGLAEALPFFFLLRFFFFELLRFFWADSIIRLVLERVMIFNLPASMRVMTFPRRSQKSIRRE
jgi:hypothetical protein